MSARRKSSAEAAPAADAAIHPDTLYTLADFKNRTGLGEHAMRTARRRGLKVTYGGNRGFVLGADFIDYLTKSTPTTSR